ncbi:acetyl-CoA C-acyltransferase [Actinocorallia sp. A-T 12471]|uniref:acetyl-CoA C-acyltransferase n=1 Tax=Actinocorallia sp. A-T 12471 TaxID=3089813 RepID=UPI0029CEB163|nr:acetyl-CoA C-acyltransferase [Actinocorallia sp. A-T 12471]MDX6740718.1 acetyl-CoA C-acyltransferase [Actinocorallia sp. A-T 12471]
MTDPVIVSVVRTPIGRAHKGSLAAFRPDDLLAATVEAALARVPELDPRDLDDLIAGCALPGGEQGFNIARITALLLGLDHLPGVTVNRFCTSSLQALRQAAQTIRCGDAEAVVACGVESQSRLARGSSDAWPDTENPAFAEAKARTGRSARGELAWRDPRLTGDAPDPYIAVGLAAENVADHYGISREEMDAYAARSHQRAQRHARAHRMIALKTPDGVRVTGDDCPRAGVTPATLSGLVPRFRDGGRVTAGNSAPLSDGAAAAVVMAGDAARARGIRPLARILATGVSAMSPEIEGPAPVAATREALAKAGMALDDVDVLTGNEPFAAQVLAYCAELGIDPARMNPLGGSIALGEPYGAAGVRNVSTALDALHHTGAATALVSIVAAGGQGMALVLERI